MIFDSKIVIEIATLDKIIRYIGVISEKITIDSNSIANNEKTAAIFSGDSDRTKARVIIEADDDKSEVESLQHITVNENSKSTYNIDFTSKIIRAIGNQASNLVTIEYSTNKPLRLEFLLFGMVKTTILFFTESTGLISLLYSLTVAIKYICRSYLYFMSLLKRKLS